MQSPLYEKFGHEKRWVNWRYVKKDGKMTKVPLGADGSMAKSNDSGTWMTHAKAESLSENLGIMATPDKETLMVDFDNCIENGGINDPILERFVDESSTYTELSPSGNGLHLFFSVSSPLDLEVSKHSLSPTKKIECYTHGRYFTVTNNAFGKPKDVRTVSPEKALSLLRLLGYPWDEKPSHELLSRMFASKNGDLIEALYNGDTSAYKGDDSSADMALLNHFAFWTGKDAALMESLWLSSPLGRRDKTQKRKDYRDRTIAAAVKNCKNVYSPVSKIDFLTKVIGKNVVVTQNTENIMRVLREHSEFKGTIRMETFKNRIEILSGGKWQQMKDADAIRIQCRIATMYPFFQTVNKNTVFDAIVSVADENQYDSAIEYLKALKWDGTSRLSSWLTMTYGTPSDAYHTAVASNWLKGLVARLVHPGCKFDHVLVLEGPQGTKKSTSLAVLGGEWHVETSSSTDNKDFFMQFSSKAIIEFSEGETLSRTEVKRLKAIITMQTDKYRPPYGRTSEEFPRRCVFAMTTNESEYLKDDTGNRRWLPVTLRKDEADIEWLKANRDQLYAEAYHRVKAGESYYEFPMKEMAEEQMKRKTRDPNTDIIETWYWTELSKRDREGGITVAQAYKVVSGGFIHRAMSKSDEMNIASVLRDALRLERKQTMMGGYRMMRWYRKEGEPDPMDGVAISVMDQMESW